MREPNTEPRIKWTGLLSSTAPNRVFIAIILGSLAGFAYALIIPLILKSVHQSPLAHKIEHIFDTEEHGEHFHLFGFIDISTPKLALAFFILCLFILICRGASQSLLARVAIDATVALRKNIYRRISQVPIQDLERIGPSRLLTAMNSDVAQVVRGATIFPGLFAHLTTLIGLLAFLLYLNVSVFLFIIGTIIVGAITYQIPIIFGRRFMARARNSFDRIQEGMRGLIYGAKELKLNQQRRRAFLDSDLYAFEESFGVNQKRGDTLVIFGMTYGDLISFFAIGAVTYAMANYYSLSRESLVGVIMVLLYITAPIVALINAIGPIAQASVATGKLQTLFNDMPVEESWDQQSGIADLRTLKLEDLAFTYGGDEKFQLGPVNIELQQGEVTFLVGGNGSGKTTLGKLLSLHYLPQAGKVYFNDHPVTAANRDAFRQSISAIYSDFYLFTQLFGITSKELESLASTYLKELKLDTAVSINNGQFSSTSLSDGQKKRLALLVTYLEDRSLYIFDEWASDQDPAFKKIFYYQILPSLKRMNKVVVVISHDDRYFHLADRVIRMESGEILDNTAVSGGENIEEIRTVTTST
ncbi:cyclic peptide export ABC transporter [Exilibacterium tricleocarpae]|uniref:Cyclic peptide export ABC transporter n=1 Tax=Exilibacterium tricleocarpae TaxID=2591008 RepID=A0A545TFP5_9GAMM|nr:cyclic peptide export ABC transporter [Exilibacterium tricleocarpae]TQV76049.1 cyclic peptide export ABC transporter [Exilibacterium tricleocarpae]